MGWAALYAVLILLVDVIFLEPAINRYRELGAKIQEEFDTDLFRLPWNTHRCQSHPDPEVINNLAAKFKTKEKTVVVKVMNKVSRSGGTTKVKVSSVPVVVISGM